MGPNVKISKVAWEGVIRGLKKGQSGDSLFVSNAAKALWGDAVLARKSITGRSSNRMKNKKDWVPPVAEPMTPEKLNLVKVLLEERMKQERPRITTEIRKERLKKVSKYIAAKIQTTRRTDEEQSAQARRALAKENTPASEKDLC